MFSRATPTPGLVVAASLVAAEALALLAYGVLEALAISPGRVTMGVTTAAFFLAYGAGLMLCAWGLWRRRSWARAPVVFAQLIQLGVAWGFRAGETALVGAGLAVVAVVVAVGVLLPSSTDALVGDRTTGGRGDGN